MSAYAHRTHCALCAAGSHALKVVMSLPATPPANEFVKLAQVGKPQDLIPLTLLLCERCGHVQLAEIVNPDRLFGAYVYVSGTSPVFVEHFKRYAATCVERFGLGDRSLVVDVGSNDGTLLKQFKPHVGNVLGIDPARDIAAKAQAEGIPTLPAFFTPEQARMLRDCGDGASLICANNVFAHAADLRDFTRAVEILLAPEGVFVFEVSYLGDVVERLLFDTIYSEHTSFHALAPLVRFFREFGLRLFDAERVDTHGGSLRCYVARRGSAHAQAARVAFMLGQESAQRLEHPSTFANFKQRIDARGEQLRARIASLRADGKRVAGFGAPAKLTTLMYTFGLTREDIDFVIDDSPLKQGLYTPGLHIPVLPSSALYERKPDACVIFAWNFADAIIAKHLAYIDGGKTFIVPLPELREA